MILKNNNNKVTNTGGGGGNSLLLLFFEKFGQNSSKISPLKIGIDGIYIKSVIRCR